MAYIDPSLASGDVVKMLRTDPRHLAGVGETAAPADAGTATTNPRGTMAGIEQTFGNMLLSALGQVNQDQLTAMDLSQKMVTDPQSVNVEDVTIALAEASLSLSMTKAIVDRALAAYREVINVR
jgi:flagellar hook-basal body complex protein FliE